MARVKTNPRGRSVGPSGRDLRSALSSLTGRDLTPNLVLTPKSADGWYFAVDSGHVKIGPAFSDLHSASELAKQNQHSTLVEIRDGNHSIYQVSRSVEHNPIFLPKIFDRYIVKTSDNKITIDHIQTLGGAEKKAKELMKKYPCVGATITSEKTGTVVKSWKASMGHSPKVEKDNTRAYAKEAKGEEKFVLYVDGNEFATYDTKREAEKVGKEEGGRWRVKKVVGNPRYHTSRQQYALGGNNFHKVMQGKRVVASFDTKQQADDYARELNQREKAGRTVSNPSKVIRLAVAHTDSDGTIWYKAASAKDQTKLNQVGIGTHGRTINQRSLPNLEQQAKLYGWTVSVPTVNPSNLPAKVWAVYRKGVVVGYVGAETETTAKRKAVIEFGPRKGSSAVRLLSQHDSRRAGRHNPETSADLYETFHGKPSTKEVVYETEEFERTNFAQLGSLVELKVATDSGKEVVLTAPNPDTSDIDTVVQLASDPGGRQLFLVGGDQAVDVKSFGLGKKDVRDHMVLGTLTELTYQTEKGFDKFKKVQYFHELGEETGVRPVLLYNPQNESLSIAGGQYDVRDIGIVN